MVLQSRAFVLPCRGEDEELAGLEWALWRHVKYIMIYSTDTSTSVCFIIFINVRFSRRQVSGADLQFTFYAIVYVLPLSKLLTEDTYGLQQEGDVIR